MGRVESYAPSKSSRSSSSGSGTDGDAVCAASAGVLAGGSFSFFTGVEERSATAPDSPGFDSILGLPCWGDNVVEKWKYWQLFACDPGRAGDV